MKEMWDKLQDGDQEIIVCGTIIVALVMFVITWIFVLVFIFDGEELIYKCSDKQAQMVQSTIKDCMSNDGFMSTCTEQAQKAYCEVVK